MEKEEAREKLRRAESDLRVAEMVLEMHENGIREIKEDIKELETIINKKGDWREKLVDPKKDKHFYISTDITSRYGVDWLTPAECKRTAALLFREERHAKIMANKIQLMQEMYAFAHVKNEGWLPDWADEDEYKWGITLEGDMGVYTQLIFNEFAFGVAVESKEIAQEMLEEFGERIGEIYNKQY